MSVVDALRGEHRILCLLFNSIERQLPTLRDPHEVREMAALFRRVASQHAEFVHGRLWPAVREHAGVDPHHLERNYLSILAALDTSDGPGETTVLRDALLFAIKEARLHMEEEERMVFAQAEEKLPAEVFDALGEEWSQLHARNE